MKKRKRRRKVWKIVLAVLAAVILIAVIAVFGFRKRSVEVEGNEYYSANSITAWIENDELSVNSLYLLLKYNFTEAELPSAVESMEVSLKNPWTVHVTVKEKDMLGYVDYDGACLYFDKDGIASLRTKELLEGVPHIEGLVFDASKVVIGSRLPVEDSSIFRKIMDVSVYLAKYNLAPDRVVCVDSGIAVYFGGVEVLLGEENYEARLAQVDPILEKIAEQYPGASGTLHLENYSDSSSAVRFVPAG